LLRQGVSTPLIHITPYWNLLSGGTGAMTLTAPWSSSFTGIPRQPTGMSQVGPCWGQRGHISHLKMKCNEIWLYAPNPRLLPKFLYYCSVML